MRWSRSHEIGVPLFASGVESSDMKVKVKNDTLFKLQPVLSSDLPDTAKVFVPQGTEYSVTFCGEAPNQHLRLELANVLLNGQKQFTWYVQKQDIELDRAEITVTVLQDTLFKQRPVIASDLSDPEKIYVKAGTEFALQAHTPAEANYTKLTLANAELGPGRFSTWYVANQDIRISGQKMLLRVLSDTLFKTRPGILHTLSTSEKHFVAKGTALDLHTYLEVEGNYLKISLTDPFPVEKGRTTWYVFAPDVAIEGTEPGNQPRDCNPANYQPSDRPLPLTLPGFRGIFYTNQTILPGGHFTWGQATHGGSRIPASAEVVYGMIRIAEVMEEIHAMFDNHPIQIVSWYRDPATNLMVGGVNTSRHLKGDAVNFVVEGYHPHAVFSLLDPWWGNRGGLASASEFTHIDARGYRARWDYGF